MVARRVVRWTTGGLLCVLVALAGGCADDEMFHVGGNPASPPRPANAVSLLPDGLDNHLLPLYVGITPGGDKLYTSCNALPTIAEIDLHDRELLRVHDLGIERPGHAKVYPDGAGRVWFSWDGEPGDPSIIRLEPGLGLVTHLDTGIDEVHHGVGLREGGAVFAGSRGGIAPGHTVLQVLDGNGGVETETILGSEVLGMFQDNEGALTMLVRSAESGRAGVFRMCTTDLALIDQCLDPWGDPFGGGFATITELPDGNYVASQDDALHLIRCDGHPWQRIQLDLGQRDVFALDDEIVLLAGSGTDETSGPNWGIARRWDLDLQPIDPWYSTGKNSRYGRVQRDENLIWFNSEGTTEVWGMDPTDGSIVDKIQLGEHIESLAVSAYGDVLYSGRLSNAFGLVDLDAGEATVVREEVIWPVAPVWHERTVWLIDQLTTELIEVDGETLEILGRHDLGLDDNTLLTFSDVAYHPHRGTVFVAHSEQGVLVEYNPQAGVPVNRWQLMGPPLSSQDLTGRLELLIFDHGVVTFRNPDGVFNLVDPDLEDVVAWNQLHPEEVDALRADKRIDQAIRTANGKRIYAGGFAVDAQTLARSPGYDLQVSTLIADLRNGHFLGWRHENLAVVILDADGHTLAQQILPVGPDGEPALALIPGDDPQLVYTEFRKAEIRRIPLRKLFIEAGLL